MYRITGMGKEYDSELVVSVENSNRGIRHIYPLKIRLLRVKIIAMVFS